MNRKQQLGLARRELDRLASAAAELEPRVLSGQARQGELDRIIGKAEDITQRIRQLEQRQSIKQSHPAGGGNAETE